MGGDGESRPRLPDAPFLYVITDRGLGEDGLGALADAALAGGAPIVQLRDKELEDGPFLREARGAVAHARVRRALVLVNDRVDVAELAEADGVHLGDCDLRPGDARRLLGPRPLLGLSTHAVEEALAAGAEPVDYIALGPIFSSSTKPGRKPLGAESIAAIRRRLALPLVAIGGITAERMPEVLAAGASGVAVISAAMVPGRVEARTRELVARLRASRSAAASA